MLARFGAYWCDFVRLSLLRCTFHTNNPWSKPHNSLMVREHNIRRRNRREGAANRIIPATFREEACISGCSLALPVSLYVSYCPQQGCKLRFLVPVPRLLMSWSDDSGVALKVMLSPSTINFVPTSVLHRDVAKPDLSYANILLTSLYLSFPGALLERDAAEQRERLCTRPTNCPINRQTRYRGARIDRVSTLEKSTRLVAYIPVCLFDGI